MKTFIISIIIIAALAISCTNAKKTLSEGDWLFELQLDENDKSLVLPVNAGFNSDVFVFSNDEEKIEATEIEYSGDSIHITMPVFGSEFKGLIGSNSISGYFYNYNKGGEYKIPFVASYGIKERFEVEEKGTSDISGTWDAFFLSTGGDSTKTIASFRQSGSMVKGTFFTEIGDYRYLEGVMDGNQLKLSTFDGAHAFLFTADLGEDGNMVGIFRSGHTFKQNWIASKNENAKIRGMKELTYLKEGYDKLTFSFPNVEGRLISLEDEKYQNKVVIAQIFGTWCPNCMDETRYLVDLHNKYHSKGLEIIGLAFETTPTLEYFKPRVERFKNDLNVPYELILAGPANKRKAAEALPMLNHILSYPTAIIIDRMGEIQEIHTGFSGPGTGEAYSIYKKEMEELIEKLLAE